jgi:hypothetical protein
VTFKRFDIVRGLGLTACGVALWCASSVHCAGQAGTAKVPSRGVLSGIVVDPSGARVAQATVHIQGHTSNRDLSLELATDNLGQFSASVPVGRFDVRVEAPGFEAAERRDEPVSAGAQVELNFRLTIAALTEQVEVPLESSSSTGAADNKSAMIFDQEKLAELSDDNATMQQQLLALAGGDPAHAPDVYVDGFSGGNFPTKSSIREVRINQNPFSAQFPGYGFNRIEIFTKPGGDKLHGNMYAIGNDAPFNANNPYTSIEPPYYSYYLDGNLSGPLIDKKTSFFTGSTYHKMQNNSVVDAIDQDSLAPLSEAVSTPDNSLTYTARIDRQMSASNTLTGRYEYLRETLTNAGVGLLVLPSEGYDSTNTSQTLQLGDTQTVSPKVVSETRFQYIRTRERQSAQNSSPTIVVEGSFNGGGSNVGAVHDNRDRYEFQEYLSIEHGKHFIRAGGQYDLLRDANESTTNYNGTYTFPTLAAYEAKTPTQFSLTAGQAGAALTSGWLGAYADDEWKVAKSVTLNAGLRFESQTAIADHADWAPRVGLAWAVGQHDKKPAVVVLRGGFGIFYERFSPSNILTSVRQNGVSQQTFLVNDPTFYPAVPTPAMLETGANAVPPTPYRISPNLHAEYDEDASFGVERALGKMGSVTATYIWARGLHQYVSENINAPLPGTYNPSDPTSGVRPLGGTQNIYQFSSTGIAKGQIFSIYGNLHPSKRLSLFTFYIFQNERNNTSGPTSFPSNSYDLSEDYGRSGLHAKQRLYAGGNLNLPWKMSANTFVTAGSGVPFNITTGSDLNGDTIYNDRPAFATDLTRASVVKTAYGTFDTIPIAGQKIIPVNYGNSPGYLRIDLSVGKAVAFGPRGPSTVVAGKPVAKGDPKYSLRFGIEAQNVFNGVNPGQPVGVLNSPLFGKTISLNNLFTPLGAANRVVDISSRFSF